ncbi:MAG: hypothetical protein FWG25_06540 [Promicromonosporaceae bacterium]|nr:hypothetical protein [Promicromonosporaceae bacterium]
MIEQPQDNIAAVDPPVLATGRHLRGDWGDPPARRRRVIEQVSTEEIEVVEVPPAIPAGVRTAIYVVVLVAGACATALNTIGIVLWPDLAEGIAAICGAITGALATIAGGLGVVYRPR